MLVDPELAARVRELWREPDKAGGKGEHMSALGTHEISSGMSLGPEPPLSPPVVRSPMASVMPTGDEPAGLPTPPPAIRPPESAAPPPPPVVHAEVPQQPEPAPAPVLPKVAPAQEPEAPVLDYFAAEAPAAPEPPAAAPAPVEHPAPTVELNTIPLVAPAPAPAEEAEPAGLADDGTARAGARARARRGRRGDRLPMMAPQPSVAPAPEPEPAAAPEPGRAVAAGARAGGGLRDRSCTRARPGARGAVAPMLQQHSVFSVVVRLRDGDGVLVGSFRDFGTAMEGAQEVIEQFSTAAEAQWPFYAGRFIRPDPDRLGRRGRGGRDLGRPAHVDRHHRAHRRVPAPRLLVDDLADLAPVAHRLP
jgi:hypothetical protein